MVRLSKRLLAIANRIPRGSRLADIGSDHALLPAYLAEQGVTSFAIAGEVNSGPWEAADKQIRQANLEHLVHVRKGDGLEVLTPGEVDVISIAGMGGSLIVQILTAGCSTYEQSNKLSGVKKLVLQPNVGEDQVRRWLYIHGWVLTDETLLKEDHITYEIITAERLEKGRELNDMLYTDVLRLGHAIVSQDLQFLMGPLLLRNPCSLFAAKWEAEVHKLERIVRSLKRSALPSAKSKSISVSQQISELKGVLACLPKDKL